MKKTKVFLAAMVFVLTMGLSFAFAGDASNPPYNGITVFSMAPAASNAETVTAAGNDVYNGITFFGTFRAATSKAASYEEGARSRAQEDSYNGVTLFSKR